MNDGQKRRQPFRDVITRCWLGLFGTPAMDIGESRMATLDLAAKKLGLTTDDLLSISIEAYYTTDLLPLRMSLLRLDADDTARTNPDLFRTLSASCKLCDVKGRCAWDMVHDPAGGQWQGYCPNAARLCAMHAELLRRQGDGRSIRPDIRRDG